MYLTFYHAFFWVALQIAAIKDMASNIERRWRQLVSGAEGTPNAPSANSAEGGSR
jgi:hypothetical protein